MTKALFLDRDGTINVDYGYVHEPGRFVFIDGIFDFCRHAQTKGYLIIVITNQSGIERGYFTEADFAETTRYMIKRFADEGVTISEVFHCPFLSGPDRKPAAGLFFKAKDKILSNSFSLPVGNLYTTANYRKAFQNLDIFSAYKNSVFISCVVCAGVVLLAGLAAFALVRYRFKLRNTFSGVYHGNFLGNCQYQKLVVVYALCNFATDCRESVFCYCGTDRLYQRTAH